MSLYRVLLYDRRTISLRVHSRCGVTLPDPRNEYYHEPTGRLLSIRKSKVVGGKDASVYFPLGALPTTCEACIANKFLGWSRGRQQCERQEQGLSMEQRAYGSPCALIL